MAAIYNIDINKLVQLVLPTFLRKPVFLALLKSTVAPLHLINRMFAAHRIETNYRLKHTSQVCFLQAALNDEFDSQLRRIRIVDAMRYDPIIFYPREDSKPVVFEDREKKNPIIFYSRGLIISNGFDFIVDVPGELLDSTLAGTGDTPKKIRFKSLINFYKLASKRYDLNTF